MSFVEQNRSNPSSIYSVDHLYSRWKSDGSRDASAELEFQADHENKLTNFLDELIGRLGDLGDEGLSVEDKSFITKVVIRLLLRNPTFIGAISKQWKFRVAKLFFWLALRFRPEAMKSIERSGFTASQAADAEIRAFAATFDISNLVHQLTANRKIIFLLPEREMQSFVLGNQPVLMQRKQWKLDNSGTWQSEIGVMDFYAVVDPALVIGIVANADLDLVQVVSTDDVQRINGLVVKYSDEVVVRSINDLQGAWYNLFQGEERIRKAKNIEEGIEVVRVNVSGEP